MICIYCGYETSGEVRCPYCGKDLSAYRRIIRTSNALYNEGLDKARVRDLSGAAEVLSRSLKYNKYHIDARNLLGLVYFETGQMVLALREWVISKNFQPEDNRVDYYLNEMQRGQMNKMDQITKKYNLAIDYCRTGDYDLAKIQLKRVLSKNAAAIHAHQLLALLYLREDNPEAAKKQLNAAVKIDVNNATTLIYLQEANDRIREKKEQSKRRHKKDDVNYAEGSDNVYTSKRAFIDTVESSRSSIVNITVGLIVGILASIFLILPMMRQGANEKTVSALVNANEEAAGIENTVASLEDKVKSLEEELDAYKGKSDVKTGYEQLIEAQELAETGDWNTAAERIANINRDILDSKGQQVYDALAKTANEMRLVAKYEEARNAHVKKEYEQAIEAYKIVVEIDESYENGAALYYLAECYRDTGNIEMAKETFGRVVTLFDKKQLGRRAGREIERLEQAPLENTRETPRETPPEVTPAE